MEVFIMKFNGIDFDTYFRDYPDEKGYFGKYGGVYIEDKLKKAMEEITEAYFSICQSRKFIAELRRIRKEFQGRPTPVTHLERLSDALGGKVQLYAKREDLNHSGAHKLNHCMGEALLAKYMGKKKVIAETGAGQHGVALATAAAYFGLECDIYMGAVDIKRQAPNVARMKILGANVIEVTQSVLQDMFAMIMMVDVSACDIPFTQLVDEMMELGNENGLVIHCMHEDIFSAMHTI